MTSVAPAPPPPLPATHHPSRAAKLVGNNLSDNLPPMVPSVVKVGSRSIATSKKCRAWQWAPFTTSGRSDHQEFNHWVRAGVEYPDYPYARFDIHLEAVSYTNEEYSKCLQDPKWTKSDTDKLMELARILELRWAVIYDRWTEDERKIEDLQYRYYFVAATLAQARIAKEASTEVSALASSPDASEKNILETAAARSLATSEPNHQPLMQFPQTGTSNKQVFDLQKEKERRKYLELLWNRGKAEEDEELELRKELKLIDAQLRKLKKSGGHITAAPHRTVSPVPPTAALLEQAFSTTAPTPMAETPYLQSGRLVPPATGMAGINKLTLKRMDTVLEEVGVPKKLVPTKRTCDLYDSVRKDILTLLTLQKVVLQKEGQLQTKRLRLAKLGGGGLSEEALLGITPAPAPAPAARPKTKAPRPPAPKTGGKTKPASAAAVPTSSTTTVAPKKAPTKKRKTKTEAPTATSATTTVPTPAAAPPLKATAAPAATVTVAPATAPPPPPTAPASVAAAVTATSSATPETVPSAKKRARKT